MRVLGIALLGCAVLTAPVRGDDKDDKKAAAVKKEMKLLDGTWEVVKVVRDGKDQPPPDGKTLYLVFSDGKLTVKAGDEQVHEATIKLDPTAKVKTWDLVPEDGPNKGKTHKGVYELKKDELKLCIAQPEKDRPTEFSSKADSGVMLITAKRLKAK